MPILYLLIVYSLNDEMQDVIFDRSLCWSIILFQISKMSYRGGHLLVLQSANRSLGFSLASHSCSETVLLLTESTQ